MVWSCFDKLIGLNQSVTLMIMTELLATEIHQAGTAVEQVR